MACLWLSSGKQGRTAQVPSFHAKSEQDESVRCEPDLGHSNFAIWEPSSRQGTHLLWVVLHKNQPEVDMSSMFIIRRHGVSFHCYSD